MLLFCNITHMPEHKYDATLHVSIDVFISIHN